MSTLLPIDLLDLGIRLELPTLEVASALIDLYRELAAEPDPFFNPTSPVFAQDPSAFFRAMENSFEYDELRVIAIRDIASRKVLGSAGLLHHPTGPVEFYCYLSREARGRGIAKIVGCRLIDAAFENGAEIICAIVNQSNGRALRVANAIGFRKPLRRESKRIKVSDWQHGHCKLVILPREWQQTKGETS